MPDTSASAATPSAAMDEFLTSYEVEFPAPRTPERWTVTHFEMALAHLLAEESLHMASDGDVHGVRLGWTEGLSRRIVDERTAVYHLVQAARFDDQDTCEQHAETLRLHLRESLFGGQTRQHEGPWNITAIAVEPLGEGPPEAAPIGAVG